MNLGSVAPRLSLIAVIINITNKQASSRSVLAPIGRYFLSVVYNNITEKNRKFSLLIFIPQLQAQILILESKSTEVLKGVRHEIFYFSFFLMKQCPPGPWVYH